MKILLQLLLFFLTTKGVIAQPTLSGNIFEYIETTISNLPGSGGEQYQDLSVDREGQWRAVINAIINGNYLGAVDEAAALNYQLIRYLHQENGEETEFYLLEKEAAGNYYYGTYLFNPAACRQLVIQCPHPRADTNTGLEGIYAFKDIGAFAYFLSATHRCNSTIASACSGTTSVCSNSGKAYRISDPAHNIRSAFHVATEVLADELPSLTFIQLHGFTKRDTDPYVIMSNGARDIPAIDYAAAIRDGLLNADPGLTFEIGHLNTAWARLLGFTNTQGRYINASLDPCIESATNSNGRFIHIEQERSRLRADETGWQKMKLALEEAFSCQSTSTLAESPPAIPYRLTGSGVLTNLQKSGEHLQLRVFNSIGQLVVDRALYSGETIQLPKLSGPGFLCLSSEEQWITSQLYLLP